MLVNLYEIDAPAAPQAVQDRIGVRVVRALAADKRRLIRFIEDNARSDWPDESEDAWLSECEASFASRPPSCFVATRQRTIVGFACYNVTGNGYFGPMGVLKNDQGKGIGRELLLHALAAMRGEGYGYAIIGWPARTAMPFYAKTVHATVIERSTAGIYSRLI